MKFAVFLVTFVALCLLTGFAAAQLQTDALANWYPHLLKSHLTPPPAVFPIAWTILYVLMGVSIAIVAASKGKSRSFLLWIFFIQLLLNFLWSILFFWLQNPVAALAELIVLECVLIFYVMAAWKEFRTSALLFVPYVLWCAFALYMNLFIAVANS